MNTVNKITNKNNRIIKENNARVASITQELNDFYSNANDKQGNKVEFKFNITALPDNIKNQKGTTLDQRVGMYKQIGSAHSLKAFKIINGKKINLTSAAAVITYEGGGSNKGRARGGVMIGLNYGADPGSYTHEVLHTLQVGDNGYTSGGILNSPPQQIISSEVEEVDAKSYDK